MPHVLLKPVQVPTRTRVCLFENRSAGEILRNVGSGDLHRFAAGTNYAVPGQHRRVDSDIEACSDVGGAWRPVPLRIADRGPVAGRLPEQVAKLVASDLSTPVESLTGCVSAKDNRATPAGTRNDMTLQLKDCDCFLHRAIAHAVLTGESVDAGHLCARFPLAVSDASHQVISDFLVLVWHSMHPPTGLIYPGMIDGATEVRDSQRAHFIPGCKYNTDSEHTGMLRVSRTSRVVRQVEIKSCPDAGQGIGAGWMTRRSIHLDATSAQVDQSKGTRSRRRLMSVGRGLVLAIVVLAPEVSAWHGLLELARVKFGLTGWEASLVPLLFGAAAFYCALLSVRHVLAGDSALTERILTWLYAAAGAGFNWWYADSKGNPAAALFFGGASLSAALLWDRTLRSWRRDELRAMGALEQPLPRFRLLRWMLDPKTTYQAFRLAVVDGLTTPEDALHAARSSESARRLAAESRKNKHAQTIKSADEHGSVAIQATPSPRAIEAAADSDQAVDEPRPASVLEGQSKSQVVVNRLIEQGADFDAAATDDEAAAAIKRMVPTVIEWAANQGVEMNRSHGYDAVRREIRRRMALQANQDADVVEAVEDSSTGRPFELVVGGEQR